MATLQGKGAITSLVSGDHFTVHDASSTLEDAAGDLKKITYANFLTEVAGAISVPTSVSSAYRTSTILSSTSNGEGAALIGIEDAGTYFTGTDVEAALQELGALLPTGDIVGTSDTQTLTNKTLTAPNVNQLNDTNGNESITLTATASGVSYLDVASGTTGNDVVLTGSGETNTGISIQASGTGNVTVGPIVIDGDATVGAGQDNYVLTYDNASGTWGPEPTGGGDVSISGTPADTYLATWASASAIEGSANLAWDGTSLQVTGDIVLTERADHGFTPAAGKGILWVSNDATQKLYFTDDAGTDNEVLTAGSGSVLADTTAASDDKFVFFDTSDSDNPKYCNDLAGDLSLAKTTGSTYTGTHNFGGADDFEVPNGTAPVVDTDGQIAIDTSVADFSHGLLKYFSGEEMAVVAMPIAQFTTPADQYVVTYDATADEFQLTVKTGSGIAAVVDDTTPQLGGMLDVNGNAIGDGTRELLTFTEDASAVNHVNIENQATGGGPIISAAGDDTNVDLNLAGKGSGIVAIGSAEVATISATQTLTNKTIDSASNTITVDLSEATVTGTTAEFNTALSDGSFATLAGTETLTNKTLNLSSNTLTGTTAQFNTALSDGSFATLAGTETLTNKTLTSPTVNTPVISHGVTTDATTARTLALGDASDVVLMSSGSANTVTIPTNASVAFATGTIITVVSTGAGTTTIAGDTGVTVSGNGGSASAGSCDIQTQYGAATLIKIGTDSWIVSGDIDAVA